MFCCLSHLWSIPNILWFNATIDFCALYLSNARDQSLPLLAQRRLADISSIAINAAAGVLLDDDNATVDHSSANMIGQRT